MYQPMLFLHWKQIRFALIPFILAAYVLPLLSVQGLGVPDGMAGTPLEAYRVVSTGQVWLPFYPLLAAAIGITMALSAWNWDHQLKHVYALSLPLTRLEYSMLKMGAGAALTLLPIAGLWIGAHVASLSITLPEGLHAYPNQLAMRFGFATLVSYTALFAMASGTIRTTAVILTGIFVLLVSDSVVTPFLSNFFVTFEHTSFVEWVAQMTIAAPGPFEVFTGSWTLIDV